MLTVLMATRNGACWIEKTLQSLAQVEAPPGGWSLVVVDSASTDGTADIVARFADRLPLDLLRSAVPGKNVALNLGLERLSGDLVAFTDDDVIVDPRWLVSLAEAAAQAPEYVVFGGAIEPVWPSAPKPWLLDWVPLGPAFSITPPMPRGECGASSVWGPNMAVRREVFRAGTTFDEAIGPDGSATYAMGSETSFTRRLAARGVRCFHVPQAIVGHMIRPTQMTRGFLLARAYRSGRGKGMLTQELEPAVALGAVPRYFLREAAEAACRFAAASLLGDAAAAFQAAWRWQFARGCIDGARAVAVNAAARPPRPALAAAPIRPSAMPA